MDLHRVNMDRMGSTQTEDDDDDSAKYTIDSLMLPVDKQEEVQLEVEH